MSKLITISECPLWWKCKLNGDGLVCEKNVIIGLCRWDTGNFDYLERLEQTPEKILQWVNYPKCGCPKRIPEDNYELTHWPDGVPTSLSGGSFPTLEEGEDWGDAVSRKFNPIANERLFPALYLKLALLKFVPILKDNPPDDIPMVNYIPENE